jgi:hypothetical protein
LAPRFQVHILDQDLLVVFSVSNLMLDRKSKVFASPNNGKESKLPADTNKRAKSIVDIATGDDQAAVPQDEVKTAAAALGRLGGLKGGKARAESLTA